VAKITAIEVENFQTIGKRTVLPIRDLTLLFGPNGAGKSIIFDALDFLRLLVSGNWGEDCSDLKNLLKKWSRNVNTQNPSNLLGVGIQIYIDEHWANDEIPYSNIQTWDNLHLHALNPEGDYAEQFLNRQLYFFIQFENIEPSYHRWCIRELTITLDTEPILEFKHDNPDHWISAYLYQKDWMSFEAIEKVDKKNTEIKLEKGILSSKIMTEVGFEIEAASWFRLMRDGYHPLQEHEFKTLFRQVIDFFKAVIGEALSDAHLVKASRTVPTRRESISLVPGETFYVESGEHRRGYRLEWSPLLHTIEQDINRQDVHWNQMFKAVASAKSSDQDGEIKDWDEQNTLERVNGFLRDELFIDNGYQLTAEVLCITNLDSLDDVSYSNPSYYAKMIRLFLKDNHQRQLEFEDVGSGIGYVLPVLASLAHDDISLIQQPELHLHPALQSNLGDVVVKSAENKQCFRAFTVIETHSEHLLLRVLRLIRTSPSRNNDVLSPITYDRVSILYFEPRTDGETIVKRLRLAPDGQLIDRWPGGFFNERFKDIFGE
jgi:hypothetical protein